MNVHQGVALHADIERLHVIAAAGHHIADLCHDKAGSKRGRVKLQKSMQLLSDTASLLAQDMRTHVNVVKGSGGTSYVAKRLATEARYSLDSSKQTFSDPIQQVRYIHDVEMQDSPSCSQADTPERARVTSSAGYASSRASSLKHKPKYTVPDDIMDPPAGTTYTPEDAIGILEAVPDRHKYAVMQRWAERGVIPIAVNGMQKRLKAKNFSAWQKCGRKAALGSPAVEAAVP